MSQRRISAYFCWCKPTYFFHVFNKHCSIQQPPYGIP
jgi:hypothetical protein